jgi:predicted DNA-binding protein with PD1-like motif
MKAINLYREAEHRRTFAFVFEPDEDPVAGLTETASEYQLASAQITAVGGFSSAILGYFDRARRTYQRIPIQEQVEVLSLLGDVAHDGDKRIVHLHCIVACAMARPAAVICSRPGSGRPSRCSSPSGRRSCASASTRPSGSP